MPVSVTMPRLGESVAEGTVTRWLKQPGDRVELDEPLLEVSTDKVDTEVPSPAAGVLVRIVVDPDETVAVGTELAVISDGVDAPADPPSTAVAEAAAPATPPVGVSVGANGAGYATPLVRRLAVAHQVDLSVLVGTGVSGRIRKEDVLKAAESRSALSPPPPAPEPSRAAHGRTERLTRLRALIADRMVDSLQWSAQLTTVVEVDVTRIAQLRERTKADVERRHGVKLTFLPFFALAALEALRAHPVLNASIDTAAGTVTYHGAEHLGIAVDTDRGLLVPVIRDAGELNLVGLAKRIADVADRARSNNLSPDDLAGGTFTVTNTGSRGALFDTPILNPPQVGILGTGAVVRRPVAVDDPDLGEVTTVRSMVYLALTYDHRLVDGADGAAFLSTLKRRLEGGAFEV
jgi:2-oxoglutarate dehydrogenase E2 component (dihydrolipoamide succinyltransferase)